MKRFQVTIIQVTGRVDVLSFNTLARAEKVAENHAKAFGASWWIRDTQA